MKYRALGHSALKVSKLCLGTMNFGPRTDEKEAFRILDSAVDLGINFVDTANQYGGDLGVGTTETIVGRWLAANPQKRGRLVIASKVYEPMSDDVNDWGLSSRHIQMACKASLERLRVDHIDLYQMHHIDRAAPTSEIWDAMDRLAANGNIIYTGSSNFPGWAIARMNEQASNRHRLGLVSEQSLYNLLERRVELEVLPACNAYGTGLIPWSPLAGGLLAEATTAHEDGRRLVSRRSISPEVQSALEKFAALCLDLSYPPQTVALAWLLHQKGIASTIIGPSSADQLRDCVIAAEIELDDTVLSLIDEIFPPCGEAPEAYAW